MDILIVSATSFEIAPLKDYLDQQFIQYRPSQYQKGQLNVSLLFTGVGQALTAYALGRLLGQRRFDLVINAGIAGAFRKDLEIGQVVQVTSERFADLGVQEADGAFTDVHQLGLIAPDQSPFKEGVLKNKDSSGFEFLPKVSAVTVNQVHGHPPAIERIRKKYGADIETMEGAAFFYVCLSEQLPFLELRSISNFVEARNREAWNIELAIKNLNEVLSKILTAFL